MKGWVLERTDWRRLGNQQDRTYDISELDIEQEKDHLFYRERWFKEDGAEVKVFE